MAAPPIDRAMHIKEAIQAIRDELIARDLHSLLVYPMHWAGFKYLLLTISEASRHLPPDWKDRFGPQIDWQGMADLGNTLRHAYHNVNSESLWGIYEHDLDPLEAAIDAMIAAHTPTPPPPANS